MCQRSSCAQPTKLNLFQVSDARFGVDPVSIVSHSCVHSWFILLATFISPAHYSHKIPDSSGIRMHQWPTRITLASIHLPLQVSSTQHSTCYRSTVHFCPITNLSTYNSHFCLSKLINTIAIILQSSPASDITGSIVWENMRCFRKADTVHITCELNSRGKFHNSYIIFMIKEKVTVTFMNNNSSDKFSLFWRSQQNSKAGSPPPRISYSVRYLRLCHSHTRQDPYGSLALCLSIKKQCGQVCLWKREESNFIIFEEIQISGGHKNSEHPRVLRTIGSERC